MNTELIKKYKKEFDSWLDDKSSIIMGYNKSKTLEPEIEWLNFIDWTFDRGIFILNDEYVELRKALAEGKIIQCNAREGQNDITYAAFGHNWWVDVTEFKYATRFYRIKPEESDKSKITKFKVGDWVWIPSLDSKPCQFSEDLCCLGLELWKPKIRERCWFSDNLYEEPILSILTSICYADQQKDIVHKYYTEYSDCNGKNLYKICQPFICELPICMKKLKRNKQKALEKYVCL